MDDSLKEGTRIALSRRNHLRLKGIGRIGMTYDQVVGVLLDLGDTYPKELEKKMFEFRQRQLKQLKEDNRRNRNKLTGQNLGLHPQIIGQSTLAVLDDYDNTIATSTSITGTPMVTTITTADINTHTTNSLEEEGVLTPNGQQQEY